MIVCCCLFKTTELRFIFFLTTYTTLHLHVHPVSFLFSVSSIDWSGLNACSSRYISFFFHKAWMWKREWNIWWERAPIIKLKSPSLSCISRSLFKKHHELLVFYMNFGALLCYWEPNTFVRSSLSYKCTACSPSLSHTRSHTHT